MSERVASGEVHIGLNDREVEAGLRRIEADFERTMAKIARERAVAEVTAEISGVDEKIAAAQRKLKKWEHEKAEAKVGADIKKAETEIKKAETSLKRLNGERATMEVKLKGEKEALAEFDDLESRAHSLEQAQRERERKKQALLARSAREEERLARASMAREKADASESVNIERDALGRRETMRREFQRAAARLEQAQGVAEASHKLGGTEDALANTKRRMRELKGLRADISMGFEEGDVEEVTAEIALVQKEIDSLDGERATIELEVKGQERALAAQAAIDAAEAKSASLREKYAAQEAAEEKRAQDQSWADVQRRARLSRAHEDQRLRELRTDEAEAHRIQSTHERAIEKERVDNWKAVQQRARVTRSLDNQRLRELAAGEREAYRMENERSKAQYDSTIGLERRVAKVINLQRQYSRLSDKQERLSRQRPIGREARIKVELDAGHTRAQMLALKGELALLGKEPPVEIEPKVDRKGWKRKLTGMGEDIARTIGSKAAGLSEMTLRLGPFTNTIRGFAVALAFLGPIITDLIGGASALIGVLGAGLAGAATVGAGGLIGLATAGAGFMFATRNTRQELTQARTSINAYQNAILKYGKNADKTKTKQKEMNSVLKQISPLAREAALGTEDFYKKWDKGTKATQNNLGKVAKAGFQALDAIRPVMARQTNELSGMLAKSMGGVRDFFRGEGKGLLSGITQDFDRSIPSLLHGLGSFGHAFMLFGREGARYLSQLTGGFDRLGGKLLAFTQRDDFGARVKRWVGMARDLVRFFGAATRVLVHFFGAGAGAGDDFVKTMTNALNRWDKFLTSDKGQDKMANAMERSVHGAEALWGAIAPLAGAFLQWANNLSPFVTNFLQAVGAVSMLVNKVTELIGLGGPLGTLGATFGAIWAVSKIGSFVSYLARAVALMKDLGAMKSIKSILTGGFFSQMKAGRGIIEAGGVVADEIRAALISGGGVVAGEIRGALATGGVAAGAEGAIGEAAGGAVAARSAGGVLLPRGAAAAEQAGIGAAETAGIGAASGKAAAGTGAFLGLRAAVMGVGGAFGATSLAGSALATGGLAVVAAGATYGIIKLMSMKSASEKLRDAIHGADKGTQAYGKASHELLGIQNALGQETHSYNEAVGRSATLKKRLYALDHAGKKGTAEYKQTLDALNMSLDERQGHYRNVQALERKQIDLQVASTNYSMKERDAEQTLSNARQRRDEQEKRLRNEGMRGVALQRQMEAANKDVARAEASLATRHAEATAAARRALVGTLNYKRGLAGFVPLAGRAATALANLAKTNPNVAAKVSVKYADPKDAAGVARRAQAAIGSGVSIKTVMRIVADSSDADDAVKRLRQATIRAKVVRISQHGGADVLAKIEAIIGRKLTPKEQRIIESGGSAAISTLRRILGIKLSDKSFRAWLSTNAPGLLAQIRASIDALHDKTVTLTTIHYTKTMAAKRSAGPSGNRRGRVAGRSQDSLVAEGRGPEWIVDPTTGVVQKVEAPEFMALPSTAYVIPTEPRYRHRGRNFFLDAAKRMPDDATSMMSAVADDLGMAKYAKGTHPSKKARAQENRGKNAAGKPAPIPTDSKTENIRKTLAKMPTPDTFKASGIPEDEIRTEAGSAHNAYTTRKGQIQSAHATLVRAEAVYADAEKKVRTWQRPHGKAGKNAKPPTIPESTKRNLRDAKQRLTALQSGGTLPGHTDKLVPLSYLKTADRELNSAATRIHTANTIMTSLKSKIDTEATQMGTDATQYSKTGNKDFYDDYIKIKGQRSTDIADYIDKLGKAKEIAQALATKYPNSDFSTLNDDLAGSIASANDDKVNNDADVPEPPAAADVDMSAEGFVETLKLTGTLWDLTEAVALSGTTEDLGDDYSTNLALEGFWANVLRASEDRDEDPRIITAVAGAWKDAHEATASALEAVNRPLTTDDLVHIYGRDDELAALNRTVATATLNNAADDPNTAAREDIATLSDDLTAAAALKDFYYSVMNRAINENRPDVTITDAIGSYTSARDTWQNIQSQIDDTAKAAADQKYTDFINYGTSREELFNSFAPNFVTLPGAGMTINVTGDRLRSNGPREIGVSAPTIGGTSMFAMNQTQTQYTPAAAAPSSDASAPSYSPPRETAFSVPMPDTTRAPGVSIRNSQFSPAINVPDVNVSLGQPPQINAAANPSIFAPQPLTEPRVSSPSMGVMPISTGSPAFGIASAPSSAYSAVSNISRTSSAVSDTHVGGVPAITVEAPAPAAPSNTNVHVENTFPTPPPDPHTWSKGLAFELKGAF